MIDFDEAVGILHGGFALCCKADDMGIEVFIEANKIAPHQYEVEYSEGGDLPYSGGSSFTTASAAVMFIINRFDDVEMR